MSPRTTFPFIWKSLKIVAAPFVYLLPFVPSCENSSLFHPQKPLPKAAKDEGSQRASSKNKTASIYWFTVSLFVQVGEISGYIIALSIKISPFQKKLIHLKIAGITAESLVWASFDYYKTSKTIIAFC